MSIQPASPMLGSLRANMALDAIKDKTQPTKADDKS